MRITAYLNSSNVPVLGLGAESASDQVALSAVKADLEAASSAAVAAGTVAGGVSFVAAGDRIGVASLEILLNGG